ncbi:hypothetical protein K2173_007913 [Erythroxylum novogranatense]|uniref:BHLH domain-containing protein n=1 Tax=Erythroxylum novogranatense TaxID=1862640 RepID=A0AAV8T825_9ROSI|nr:hypothetical protein K2173_007913 [Erythroxylum novogranatense]
MALEAVVYAQDPFSCGHKDGYGGGGGGGGGSWGYDDYGFQEDDKSSIGFLNSNFSKKDHKRSLHANWDYSSPSIMRHLTEWDPNSSPEACIVDRSIPRTSLLRDMKEEMPVAVGGQRKRRRTKNTKNKEEIESLRMTHIAVERNRRKQMNEYLSAIRSLMPASYVQRGDQASIIGGAINFVKELEQQLHTMESNKRSKQTEINGFISPFVKFFSFPQYSKHATQSPPTEDDKSASETHRGAAADIEVTVVESHANLKILSKKRPGQLLKMVAGFQSLRLTVLHLNVTSDDLDQMALYSVSVKVSSDLLQSNESSFSSSPFLPTFSEMPIKSLNFALNEPSISSHFCYIMIKWNRLKKGVI